jgi:hypothetical protein
MERIKPAVAPLDSDSTDLNREKAAEGLPGEMRSLADYELWFVGGGDDVPGWGH